MFHLSLHVSVTKKWMKMGKKRMTSHDGDERREISVGDVTCSPDDKTKDAWREHELIVDTVLSWRRVHETRRIYSWVISSASRDYLNIPLDSNDTWISRNKTELIQSDKETSDKPKPLDQIMMKTDDFIGRKLWELILSLWLPSPSTINGLSHELAVKTKPCQLSIRCSVLLRHLWSCRLKNGSHHQQKSPVFHHHHWRSFFSFSSQFHSFIVLSQNVKWKDNNFKLSLDYFIRWLEKLVFGLEKLKQMLEYLCNWENLEWNLGEYEMEKRESDKNPGAIQKIHVEFEMVFGEIRLQQTVY